MFVSVHDFIHRFLKAPLRQVFSKKYAQTLKYFQFMLHHNDGHRSELIFAKCNQLSCTHCTLHPVKAKKTFQFLQQRGTIFYNPQKIKKYDGHFKTLLEMVELNRMISYVMTV